MKIEVVSQHHPSIKTVSNLVLEYDEDLYFNWNANRWGYSAMKQVRITDVDTGTKIRDFKIKADKTIRLYCIGEDEICQYFFRIRW